MTDVEEMDLRRPGDPAPASVPLWRVQAEAVAVLVLGALALVGGCVAVVLAGAR